LTNPYLILSGGVTRPGFPAESVAACSFLVSQSPLPLRIPVLLELAAKNTTDNAVYCHTLVNKVVPPPTYCNVFAVTDLSHSARWTEAVRLAFNDPRFFVTPAGALVDGFEDRLAGEARGLQTLREAFERANHLEAVPALYLRLAQRNQARSLRSQSSRPIPLHPGKGLRGT